MTIDILTLFPPMFAGPFDYSIVKRAREQKNIQINIHDLRDWATDKYKSVDDRPYGGGAGMVMRVDILHKAIMELKKENTTVIILDAGGKKFSQEKAVELSHKDHLILICGHYEGIDHRIHEHYVDEIISIGDYVLSGGEIPSMVLVDSITRLIPGVLGNEQSLLEESHNNGAVEYPQYTRPEEYNGIKVPEILLSGDHKKIDAWRKSKQ
jgi:tRNA (guanine37-N1)-methyltransferase